LNESDEEVAPLISEEEEEEEEDDDDDNTPFFFTKKSFNLLQRKMNVILNVISQKEKNVLVKKLIEYSNRFV